MGPFSSAAASLYANGWHPIPLPPGSKAPPPIGYTGDGPDADANVINQWIQMAPDDNVGLRLATDIIGIDVDNYGTHHGADTLARLIGDHGPLPSTWSTTSRGMGPSRISYYHVPDGVRFPGMLGDGVDVIQHHHRYAVGPPSVHPDTRTIYRWHHEHTSTPRGPHVDDIPALPEPWLSLQHRDVPAPVRADNINALLGADVYGDDSIAATIANRESWHYRLAADGWMPVRHNRANESGWRRPGKATGLSAVLHEPDGPFVVFSSSIAALQHRWAETANGTAWAFSMFGYIAATRYGGDRSRCAREERQHADDNGRATFLHATAATTVALLDAETMAADNDAADTRASWHFVRFDDWGAEAVDTNEWLAWPLIPAGRSVAIHAPAKAGKSIVTLAAVAAMVGGRDLYGRWPIPQPVPVLYVDYEMTEGDLFDRLDELGYGPDDAELHERLTYAVLPTVAPLDTVEGGAALLAMARSVGARCVILDTFGRAVHGPENDADTVRNFYRYTGAPLKAAGITVVRLDHTGKDLDKGQRGTSSKNEDVDLVWRLSRTNRGAILDATHTRMSNVPRAINLERVDDLAVPGLVKWVSFDETAYPAGTSALIAEIDAMDISIDVSANAAYKAYHDGGGKARRASFLVAHKCRIGRYQPDIHNQQHDDPIPTPVPPHLPAITGDEVPQEPPVPIGRTGVGLYRDPPVPGTEKPTEGRNDGPIEFPY